MGANSGQAGWEGIHVTHLWAWSLQLLPAGKRLALVEVNAVEKVDIQGLELKVLCVWKKTKARGMLAKEQLRRKVLDELQRSLEEEVVRRLHEENMKLKEEVKRLQELEGQQSVKSWSEESEVARTTRPATRSEWLG